MYMHTLLTGIGSCFVISGLVLRHIGTSYSLDDIGLHSSDRRAGMFDDGSSGIMDSVEEAYWFVLLPGYLCWYLKYMSRFSRVGIQSSPKNLLLCRAMVT